MATLKSVASEQGVKTPDVQQSFRLLAELARQLRKGEALASPSPDRKEHSV